MVKDLAHNWKHSHWQSSTRHYVCRVCGAKGSYDYKITTVTSEISSCDPQLVEVYKIMQS